MTNFFRVRATRPLLIAVGILLLYVTGVWVRQQRGIAILIRMDGYCFEDLMPSFSDSEPGCPAGYSREPYIANRIESDDPFRDDVHFGVLSADRPQIVCQRRRR